MNTNTEPVAIAGAIEAVFVAVMALLIGIEVVTAEVGGLILGVISAGIAAVTVIVRSRVSPVTE